jgi:site-specific DNA-adenine methylase
MALSPLFKWFGSKWAASKYYPAPIHDYIDEPFAGGAGYSLRHHTKKVRIWETNLNLQVLWNWLINEATSESVREIPLEIPEGVDIRTLGLSAGQAMLLKHWQRTNNYGDCWTVSPWGNKPGQWTANTRARVAEEIHGVKHWEFAPCTYDSGDVTYFIDPPYQFNYRYGGGAFDYEALVQKLRDVPHPRQIIACEATCPKTGRMPDWLDFRPFRRTVTSRRKAENHHHSNELLCHIINDRVLAA